MRAARLTEAKNLAIPANRTQITRALLRPSFADTLEAYYRLLEQDGTGADA